VACEALPGPDAHLDDRSSWIARAASEMEHHLKRYQEMRAVRHVGGLSDLVRPSVRSMRRAGRNAGDPATRPLGTRAAVVDAQLIAPRSTGRGRRRACPRARRPADDGHPRPLVGQPTFNQQPALCEGAVAVVRRWGASAVGISPAGSSGPTRRRTPRGRSCLKFSATWAARRGYLPVR
jgi:hypothetical protein